MGSFSIWHWLIVLVVVLILFGGRGKISQIMGDFGKGLKAFKKSIKEDEGDPSVDGDEPRALKSDSSAVHEHARDNDREAKS